MNLRFDKYRGIVTVAGVLLMGSAQAFDMGNMMNPSQWMGGNNSRDRGSRSFSTTLLSAWSALKLVTTFCKGHE